MRWSMYLYASVTKSCRHIYFEAGYVQYHTIVCRSDSCFLHSFPANNISSIPPLIHSTAAGLAVFPNNQDHTHNYSWQTQAVQSLAAHVSSALPGWQSRYQEKVLTQAMDFHNVQQFSYLRERALLWILRFFLRNLFILVFPASLCET